MTIDRPTLMTVLGLVSLAAGAMFFALGALARQLAGVRYWAVGCLAIGFATVIDDYGAPQLPIAAPSAAAGTA